MKSIRMNTTAYRDLVHWGTSTWTYPGWQGIVYHRPYTEKSIKTESLAEYAAFPLFTTVGIDNTFYAPPNPYVLQSYARYLPPGFKCVSKVWETITTPRWPKQSRYGKNAGLANPDFLDSDKFISQVLSVYDRVFKDHTGPLVFEFGEMYPPVVPSLRHFLERLDRFLGDLPDGYQYGVEIRNSGFLKPAYFKVLRSHGVAHVFNHWTRMPPLREQITATGGHPFTADFGVARLLTPIGVKYEDAVKMNTPYDAIKARLPQMRDDLEDLIDQALGARIPLYVLVNNRTEGCAPITVQEMDERIRDRWE